jgi:hypothetical protein
MDGRPSQESWHWPCCRVRHMGIIWMILELGMVVQVLCPCVNVVKGAEDVPIFAIVAVKSVDEEAVDNPREVGALAKGAVDSKSMGKASAGRGVEGDALAVAKPNREVGDHHFLLNQARCKISAARDERIGLVNQVTRRCFREGPLLRGFPSGLFHHRRQLGATAVLWRQ